MNLNPSPRRVIAHFALIICFIAAGLWFVNQSERANPTSQTQPPITADSSARLTYDSPTVQAWTATESQVDPIPSGSPGNGTPVTSGVGCQEDNPCWDCATMGDRSCGPAVAEEPVPSTLEDCQEDMPCWDCLTMGNRVCGTIDDSSMAWAVWDEVGASRGAVSDPSRDFRVDYLVSTDTYPENLTPGDLPLLGQDGRWYVFHVELGPSA